MIIVLLLLSSVFSVVPMLFFLGLIWWMDRYDREPIWLLALTFLWGAIGGVAVALIGSTILALPVGYFVPTAADSVGAVIIAPLIEEPSKALFLLFVLWSRHFDNMTDGFVYGAAAGLGFGMTENFLYFSNAAISGDLIGWVMTVVIRTLYSAVMHASASSVVGAALGFARFRGFLALGFFGIVGLGLAMGIHALWNGLLTLDAEIDTGGALFGVDLLLFPLEFLFIFAIFQLCLLEESWTIKRELKEEADSGLIPAEHARIIASWWRRGWRGWTPKGVDHFRYVQAATALAMRKKQARQSAAHLGMSAEFYRDEVDRLRKQIRKYLDAAKPA